MKNNKIVKELLDTFKIILPPSVAGIFVYLAVFLLTVIDEKLEPYKRIIPVLKFSYFKGDFFYQPLIDIGHGIRDFTSLPAVGTITVYIFWAVIGVIVYLLANRVVSDEQEMAGAYSLKNYIWPSTADASQPFKDLVEKLIIRFAVAIFIIVYIIKLIPIIDGWWQREHQDLVLTSRSLEINLLLLLFEALFMHGLVVLLRLFFGRKRLLKS
jgi:hypothetical protein